MNALYLKEYYITPDQAWLNFFVYSGILSRIGIKHMAQKGYPSIAVHTKEYAGTKIGDLHNIDTGYVPLLIHQYTRSNLLKPIPFRDCGINL
jgi:hypothetical protein